MEGMEMEETFIGDATVFVPEMDVLLDRGDLVAIEEMLTKKHLSELEEDKTVAVKQIDLYIWQAILVRRLSSQSHQVVKDIIHYRYNDFYRRIGLCQTLVSCQRLEKELFYTYINGEKVQSEVTYHRTLNHILTYIHLHIEAPFTLDGMVDALRLTKPYLSRLFKQETGQTVMSYVTDVKINRAKVLLRNTHLSILAISERLGYYDSSHFGRVFKKVTGLTPRAFRQQNSE
jgi:YesN/AraC family two-component response regulator